MSDVDTICCKLIEVMNSCGYDITTDSLDEPIDYDSLQFISTMVEIENEFEVQIPDEFLLAEGLDTPRDFLDMVLHILN